MTIKQQLQVLATEKNTPCVTISLNTHRTHPSNSQDIIRLKNLLDEAENRVIQEFDKRPTVLLRSNLASIRGEMEENYNKEFGTRPESSLRDNLSDPRGGIDENYNLDSLHIYVSNDTKVILRLPWSIHTSGVHISDTFDISTLIQTYNRSEEYLILLLSQSGANLYYAINNTITKELKNDDFPIPEIRKYNIHSDNTGDSKHLDNLVREFLNNIDSAMIKVHDMTRLHCVVICTEDNYSRLMQIASKPELYYGYAHIDYNHINTDHIAKQAWEIIESRQHTQRVEAIHEMQEAVGQKKVLTDLQKIYQAALDGRGDLLIVHQDFTQSVLMTSDRTFDIITDTTLPNVINDITSHIAWDVLSKDGRVVFTQEDEIKQLGNIVLKTRY